MLREALLGPLSPLADATFYSDLVFDIVWSAVLATLVGRVTTLFMFTGAVQDHISIGARIAAKVAGILFSQEKSSEEFVNQANSWIENRLTALEFCFAAIAFAFFYFGNQMTGWSLLFGVGAIFLGSILCSHVLLHIKVASFQDARVLIASGDGPKVAILFSLFAVVLLLLSVGAALVRASEITGRNVVALQKIGSSGAECVSILGKTSYGVFFERVFAEDDRMIRAFFLPNERIDSLAEIGGSEFFWERAPEKLGCGVGDLFWN